MASVLNFYFQTAISDRFSVVRGAEGAQIQRIFPNRNQALSQIKEEVEKVTESIDALCVSGTDLLHPNTALLKELDRRCQGGNSIHVRILILDPRSGHAVERSLREEGVDFVPSLNYETFGYASRKLCRDTLLSLQQLENILEDIQKRGDSQFRLKVRLYDAAPMMHYVRIDRSAFVEQYHLGVPHSEVRTTATKCLGKLVPMVEVTQTSDLGHIVNSHFQYLWDASEARQFAFGACSTVQEAVQNTDWVERYAKSKDGEMMLTKAPDEQMHLT